MLIDHFSLTNSGRMSLHEFTQAILPATSPVVRDKVLSRPAFAYLAKEAELSLQGLLCKELEIFEYIVQRKERFTVNEEALFRLLSPLRLPVDSRTIFDFLNDQCCQVTAEDSEAVMRRFDLDKDGILSYEEFSRVLGVEVERNARRSIEHELRRVDSKSQDKFLRSPVRKTRDDRVRSDLYLSPSAFQETDASELRSAEKPKLQSGKSQYLTPQKPRKVREEITPPKTRYLQTLVPDCSDILYQSLSEQLNILNTLEQSKQELARFSDFSPYLVFRQFDSKSRGQVSVLDFEDTLDSLGVKFYKDEIYMLLRSYGKQRDGELNYRDFLKMLTPRLDYTHEEPHESIKEPEHVSALTHSKVCEHFRKLLEAEELFESLRHRLNETQGYTNHHAFQRIDKDRDGFINSAELKAFVGEHEGFVSLFEKLDKDGDGKISFADFVDEWTPRSPRQM
mmetsp:Transcript_32342/g.55988  ORF Transcript_32342/g.55988 Transcript_32342/m.55988 type:complete len:452 (+) Transcript_32342:201-1556(+)